MGCKRFTQIRIPTRANAAKSNLDPQDFIRRMTSTYDIDYDAIGDTCRFHITFGTNQLFGGTNTAFDHIDFDGKIETDEEVFYGQLYNE